MPIYCTDKKNNLSLHPNSTRIGDSLAQQVEHIPFKDGVLGSNPRRITKRKAKRRQQKDKSYKINILWDFFCCPLATFLLSHYYCRKKKIAYHPIDNKRFRLI